MHTDICSTWSRERTPEGVARALADAFAGMAPVAIVFFASHRLDGRAVSERLKRRYPKCAIIGCTTAGEFTSRHHDRDTTTALALGARKVRRAAAALATFSRGVRFGIDEAVRALTLKLGTNLRALPPERYAGVVLLEGLKMREEEANVCLTQAAPGLTFIGGSAGDNCEFRRTRVFVDGQESDDGAALLVLDCAVPFMVSKTCSFTSTGHRFKVTAADPKRRIVHTLSGYSVAEAYRQALHLASIDTAVVRRHPVGVMVNGEAWVRTPKDLTSDGSCMFFSQLDVGMDVEILEPTDLIADTRAAVTRAEQTLGRAPQGGLVFNCALRREQLDERGQLQHMLDLFSGYELAGFHTYGESFASHINHSMLTLWFG